MSGHSKWSKVKHQKATTDVLKGAAFTKATRAITIAVKEGGGVTDPNTNFHLRLAVEKARAVNMPKENIQRAMEKAKGTDAQELHQVAYEAYGPFGIAFYIEAATDNMNRTVSFIKQTLEHQGGSMAGPGAESLYRIKTKLEEKNVTIDSSSVVMQAKAGIIVPSEKQEIIDTLVERLEQSEDIQRVFTNT